jgi:hypothetical protein
VDLCGRNAVGFAGADAGRSGVIRRRRSTAELRQLAADLRIDLVMQDRFILAGSFESDRGSPLGKARDAARTFAGNPVSVRRIEIAQRNGAAEGGQRWPTLRTTVAVMSVGDVISRL